MASQPAKLTLLPLVPDRRSRVRLAELADRPSNLRSLNHKTIKALLNGQKIKMRFYFWHQAKEFEKFLFIKLIVTLIYLSNRYISISTQLKYLTLTGPLSGSSSQCPRRRL